MSFQDKIRDRKNKEKIVMLTAYDFQTAKILDEIDLDMILVGDSSGMVVQGCKNTKNVTMNDMLYHTRAVVRGVKNTPVIGDMPLGSDRTPDEALRNARLFIEAGAQGVKIEGNKYQVVKALSDAGIPVMGHVGMLPQQAETYHLTGRKPEEASAILADALSLDKLGVFSIVLECIPESLGRKITEATKSPTIGIGAGKYCDGQVLVINDLLGMDKSFKPKFVKRYADLDNVIRCAVARFKEEVQQGDYPDAEHTYH